MRMYQLLEMHWLFVPVCLQYSVIKRIIKKEIVNGFFMYYLSKLIFMVKGKQQKKKNFFKVKLLS